MPPRIVRLPFCAELELMVFLFRWNIEAIAGPAIS